MSGESVIGGEHLNTINKYTLAANSFKKELRNILHKSELKKDDAWMFGIFCEDRFGTLEKILFEAYDNGEIDKNDYAGIAEKLDQSKNETRKVMESLLKKSV